MRENGARRQGNSHAWYGRILCGSCGQPYVRRTFRTKGAKAVKYHVWCCKGRITGSGCRNPNVREERIAGKVEDLEKAFISRNGEVVGSE